MVTRLEEEIEAYKKQMEEHLRELEAKQATFVKASRKLDSIITRLSKVMDDYQAAYEDVLASGVSVADAKANGINTLNTVIKNLQANKRSSKVTVSSSSSSDSLSTQSDHTSLSDDGVTSKPTDAESVTDSDMDQAQSDESFTPNQY